MVVVTAVDVVDSLPEEDAVEPEVCTDRSTIMEISDGHSSIASYNCASLYGLRYCSMAVDCPGPMISNHAKIFK